MFYSFTLTITAAHTAANKLQLDLEMSAGIVHQVDILFPDDADHNIRVQIFDANLQLWPTNRGAALRGDAAIVSFRDFYEMSPGNNTLRAYAWWEDTETATTVFANIGVLPRAIIQPFSLAELLRSVQRS
ncbi:hypothetical protein LCGC14_0978490 [marine sediment metagenome]|uniref:Uncharacterized protein n=1 Tax=marine sediment metagenome TaxID=412755 RepID=A0A0F9NVQ2_9ZZZZ